MPLHRIRILPTLLFIAVGCSGFAPGPQTLAADTFDGLAAARVPKDAAFLSSSLRLREQAERFITSRAFATLRELPAVKRAIEAFEEQKSLPGNPLALASILLEQPENQQAVEVLADLVSNDSFVYGDPSCVKLLELFQKIQAANQIAGVVQMVEGVPGSGGMNRLDIEGFDIDLDELDELDEEDAEDDDLEDEDEDEDIEDEDEEDEDDRKQDQDEEKDEDDDRDTRHDRRRRLPVMPVRFRDAVAEAEPLDELPAALFGRQLLLTTLVDNLDQIVVPDIVWGFKVGKKEAATTQLARLVNLLKTTLASIPDLSNSLDREEISGHEFTTFSISGESLPWDELDIGRLAEESKDVEKVLERLRSLRLVIAIGIVEDRVILSVGDSVDHLSKLLATTPADGLLATPAFKPLAAVDAAKITGIAYVSEPLARASAPSAEGLRRLAALSGRLARSAGVPDAEEDVRRLLLKIADDTEKRLPVPGAWMAYSLLGEGGYEGAAWDYAKNVPIDGTKPLSLLDHTGGNPLAAVVVRVKNDPAQFEEMVSWINAGRSIVEKHLKDEQGRREFGEFVKVFGPLISKLADVVRTKLLPSLADGQVGFVFDAKTQAKRLHEEMPSAAEPLPLPEPAMVLGVSDPKVFQDGINDLFDLADELLDTIRRFSPDSVPEGYRIPDPERTKTDAGTIWSFAIPSSGLDDKIRPTIALGSDAVALTLGPAQAERLLAKKPFEAAPKLGSFDKPLAVAASYDNVGLLAAIEPWVAYGVRFSAAMQRDGAVDAAETLDAQDDDEFSRDVLGQVRTVFDVLECFHGAAAETTVEGEARVTRWRNRIQDLPVEAAKPR